jgi:release factor glutamine methyltransferase
VLDLCAGSGFLALTAAERGARAVAVDISRLSTLAVNANARLNGVSVTAKRGDLFGAVDGRRFDFIVTNPPYLPGPDRPVRGRARAWEGGPRGRFFLDLICARAPDHLRPGGVLLLVQSSVCSVPETVERLERRGFEVRIAASERGPLGPLLRARSEWLVREGLLGHGGGEDIVVIRAELGAGLRHGAATHVRRPDDSPARQAG